MAAQLEDGLEVTWAEMMADVEETAAALVAPASECERGILARMDTIERQGRLLPARPVTVKGERFHCQPMTHMGKALLTFTSCERAGGAYEMTVNGRTVHGSRSHSRRVLVNEVGDAFPEIDGRINLYARKYLDAARLVMRGLAAEGRSA